MNAIGIELRAEHNRIFHCIGVPRFSGPKEKFND